MNGPRVWAAGLLLTIGMLAVAVISIVGGDDNDAAVADRNQSSEGTQQSVLKDADPENGVGVHGHWIITVRENDGTLVRRFEFDNALVNDGGAWLAEHLSKTGPLPFFWRVVLISNSAPVCTSAVTSDLFGSGTVCAFGESSLSHTGTSTLHSTDITLTAEPGGVMRLAGQLTMEADGSINEVGTWIAELDTGDPCVQSQTCPIREFTRADAPNGGNVPVSAGQLVDVQVDIAFTNATP